MITRLVEPYAGLGAYTVRAMAMEAQRTNHRRYRLEPPVSRMGSKAGFAAGVFRAFGLTPARWAGFWLNDLDPVCHLFHMVYASSELRDAVARRIWAMVPCPECHPDVVVQALEGKIKPTPETLPAGSPGCSQCLGTGTQNDRILWERFKSEPVPGGVVDASARALYLQSRSFQLKPVSIDGKVWLEQLPAWVTCGFGPEDGKENAHNPRWTTADRLAQFPPSGQMRLTQQDATLCLPTGDSRDCVVVLDPPYEATSGYASTSCRADVLMLARAWSDAGALVLLHEACPLADELGKGWQSRSASILRASRSTFWKGEEREFLTFNRPPVWWPAEQQTMGW